MRPFVEQLWQVCIALSAFGGRPDVERTFIGVAGPVTVGDQARLIFRQAQRAARTHAYE